MSAMRRQARSRLAAAAARLMASPIVVQLILDALRTADPAVTLRPDGSLVDRRRPGNPNGPRVVSYNRLDPLPVTIGAYSSINDNTYLLPGSEHRIDHVSTWVFPEHLIPLDRSVTTKGPITIGSDVLTSFQSLILSGVTVGHGAVIAARAVVSKDVPAYAIVAGVPARVIAYRFDEPTREALLRIAWWEWGEDRVAAHASQLAAPDAAGFVARHDPQGPGEACADCGRSPHRPPAGSEAARRSTDI